MPNPQPNQRATAVHTLIEAWRKRAGLKKQEIAARADREYQQIVRAYYDPFRYPDKKPSRNPDRDIAVIKAFTKGLFERERCRAEEAIEFLRLLSFPEERYGEAQALFPEREWAEASRAARLPFDDLFNQPAPPPPAMQRPLDGYSNLPVAPTVLIGREPEVDSALALLQRPNVQLLTFVGAGGIGKTRLALEVGARLHDQFEGRVCFVKLAPIHEPDLVVTSIAETLGIPLSSSRGLLDNLKKDLKNTPLLLVLDNFEQVVSAGPTVAKLLEACPTVKIIVTSREPLRIRAEQRLPVRPLKPNDAATFFVERAKTIDPGFELTEENAFSVAAICVFLEGSPLAIELAAARIEELYSPKVLLERLRSSRLEELKDGPGDMPERHQTLRSTISWSYNLLSKSEQKLFNRLAIFENSYTDADVEAVCNFNGDLDIKVTDGLSTLAGKSLLEKINLNQGESSKRYAMLETIREFAYEQLRQSGEEVLIQRQYALYYVEIAKHAELLYLKGGEYVLESLALFDQERVHIDTGWKWARQHDIAELLLDYAAATVHIGGLRYEPDERIKQFEAAVAAAKKLKRSENLNPIWMNLGNVYRMCDIVGMAMTCYKNAYEAAYIAQHESDKGKALIGLGNTFTMWGDIQSAISCYTEFLSLPPQSHDLRDVYGSQANLGYAYGRIGDWTTAVSFYEKALDGARTIGDPYIEITVLRNIGDSYRYLHNASRAYMHYRQSIERAEQIGDKRGILHASRKIVFLLKSQGEEDLAAAVEKLCNTVENEITTYASN